MHETTCNDFWQCAQITYEMGHRGDSFLFIVFDEWHHFLHQYDSEFRLDRWFFSLWFNNWMISWAFAFPVVLCVLPLVRKFTGLIVDMTPLQPPK